VAIETAIDIRNTKLNDRAPTGSAWDAPRAMNGFDFAVRLKRFPLGRG
jgi:hypothetical protein